MAVLQKVLSILPKQNRVQLGSYIVNIAQGNIIHIGDRITYQIDAEIKEILQQLQQALQPNHQEPAADNNHSRQKT